MGSAATNPPVAEKPAAKSRKRSRKSKRFADDEVIDLASGEILDNPAT